MTLIPLSYSLQPRKSGEQLGSPIHFIGVLFVGLFLTGSKINKTTGRPNQEMVCSYIISSMPSFLVRRLNLQVSFQVIIVSLRN